MKVKDFESVFNLLTKNTRYDIELRAFPSKRRIFTREYSEVGIFLEENQLENCFFGVNTREGGGTKEHVREIVTLYADIDFKDYSNTGEAISSISKMDQEPTLIVFSGHGLQVYWFLDEAYDAQQYRNEVEEILKGMAITLGSDIAVAEIARVMRVPGTTNWKDRANPKKAEIRHFNEEAIYSLSEFSGYSGVRQKSSIEIISQDKQFNSSIETMISEINATCAFMRYCHENRQTLSEPFWQAMISNLSRCSNKAAELCHAYSQGYKKYTKAETDKKILHAIDGSAPITCKHLRNNLGFKCGGDCTVTSPVVLINKKLRGDKIVPDWQKTVEDEQSVFYMDDLYVLETAFPFDIFPSSLSEVINRMSVAFNVDPEIIGASMIAILSSAIGHSIRISPKEGQEEAPFIWLINIAPTGYGKSHPVNALMKTVERMQAREYQRYCEEMRRYEREQKREKRAGVAEDNEKPTLIHYYTSDTTIEGLADALESNPRGLLISQDELAGLILGLNQYKGNKGNDRQHFLELFNCKSWKIDRKSRNTMVKGAGAAIVGGIQTSVLPKIFKGDAFQDGLLPRFILLLLGEDKKRFTRHGTKKEDLQYWESLIEKCYRIQLEFDGNGFVKPAILRLNEEALDTWEGFYNEYYELMPFLSDRSKAFIPKLITYGLKFSGIIHIIRELTEGGKIETPIDKEIIQSAIRLTKFFAGQAVKVMKLYEPYKKTLNEHASRMIRTLHDLRNEVKNGRLLLGRIRETYNDGLKDKFQLASKPVASILKRELKLQTDKFTDNDTYLIWEEDKIEALFGRVISVIKGSEL